MAASEFAIYIIPKTREDRTLIDQLVAARAWGTSVGKGGFPGGRKHLPIARPSTQKQDAVLGEVSIICLPDAVISADQIERELEELIWQQIKHDYRVQPFITVSVYQSDAP